MLHKTVLQVLLAASVSSCIGATNITEDIKELSNAIIPPRVLNVTGTFNQDLEKDLEYFKYKELKSKVVQFSTTYPTQQAFVLLDIMGKLEDVKKRAQSELTKARTKQGYAQKILAGVLGYAGAFLGYEMIAPLFIDTGVREKMIISCMETFLIASTPSMFICLFIEIYEKQIKAYAAQISLVDKLIEVVRDAAQEEVELVCPNQQ